MPSPVDIPAIAGVSPNSGEEDSRAADDNLPFSALAFKIMADPYVRRSWHFSVCIQVIFRQVRTCLTRPRVRRNVSAAYCKLHANHREEIDTESYTGDIAAAVG